MAKRAAGHNEEEELQPGPETMYRLTKTAVARAADIKDAHALLAVTTQQVQALREPVLHLRQLAFADRHAIPVDVLQPLQTTLTTRLDALIASFNRLQLHVDTMERNLTDFYTLAVEAELAHRVPSKSVLRPPGAPLQVDVSTNATGVSLSVQDDDAPFDDILNVSAF